MLTRTLRVTIAALLLTAGGGWLVHAGSGATWAGGASRDPGSGAPSARADEIAQVAVHTARRARCNGLTRKEVRGEEPTYTKTKLAVFRNHQMICRGVWLPRPRQLLVPQGLALSGGAAWVSGYRFRKGFGERPCRLVRVDLATGRRLGYHRSVKGRVGNRPRTYCRHGGGLVQRGRWLWLVEASKLWLVAPSRGGRDLEAQRVWRIEAPVRGSTIVMKKKTIGLVPFQKSGVARVYWFSKKLLKRPGVLDLAVRSEGRHQLGAIRSQRIPRLVQGATLDSHGRLWLARSNLSCGELITPGGRRLAFVPGAEGIQFGKGSHRLWTVSESGSQPYATRLDKPFTPGIVGYAWPKLLHGKPAGCGFKTY